MNIPRGMLVTHDVIKTHEYPRDLIPTGAILKAEDAEGRSAFTALVVGEPLLESKLSPKGQRGLATLVSGGMRAFTITTNVASGVAGFILPGNKVDVLLTISNGGNNDNTGGGSTTTLLQNVEILAVDQRVEGAGGQQGRHHESPLCHPVGDAQPGGPALVGPKQGNTPPDAPQPQGRGGRESQADDRE